MFHRGVFTNKKKTLFSYSVVFWFGDLNFRIDDLEMQVVKSAIDNNKFPLLWEKDQVRLNKLII